MQYLINTLILSILSQMHTHMLDLELSQVDETGDSEWSLVVVLLLPQPERSP